MAWIWKKKKVSLKSENMPPIRKGKQAEYMLQGANIQTEAEYMPEGVPVMAGMSFLNKLLSNMF